MLMFTEQKGEGRTTQESTQSNVLYELNSGIRGYNQLDTPGPKVPHTHRKALMWFRECSIQSHLRNNSPPSPLVSESPRGAQPHSWLKTENIHWVKRKSENFRNSFVGRDTNGAKIVPSVCRLKMSTLHFQPATNCQATDLSQPC